EVAFGMWRTCPVLGPRGVVCTTTKVRRVFTRSSTTSGHIPQVAGEGKSGSSRLTTPPLLTTGSRRCPAQVHSVGERGRRSGDRSESFHWSLRPAPDRPPVRAAVH